jgi:AP-2 complex subunit alpha
VQQNNAQNAVLFEAINLIIHLDTEQDLVVQISSKLGRFIQSKETNVRYLGLEAMTHLAARAETLDPIKRHQNIILASLRDRDISVRRKGLDLLYSMCDASNAVPIVSELLRYLQNADYAIREEMVLKLAILTEKYAADVRWYVDTTLRLIAMAGDHVSDEVWQRVIQIVTNNDELQEYAARNTLQYISDDQCHETLVKIGAYILGEFGHLIADKDRCSPIEQFLALKSKMQSCSSSSRAILLSCFIKFVNLFPEIKPQLLQVFRAYSQSLDPELQQRACEYLALANLPTDDLLRTVCDEMPPFPQRASALLSRLHQKHANTTDKLTWAIERKDSTSAESNTGDAVAANGLGIKRSFTTNGFTTPAKNSGGDQQAASPVTPNGSSANDLAGLDMTAADPTVDTRKVLVKPLNLADAAHLSPGWEAGYYALIVQSSGVLYEDAQVQIGLRSEYRGALGCVVLAITNKSAAAIGALTTTLGNTAPGGALRLDAENLPEPRLDAGAQARQTLVLEARSVFRDAPTVRVSYLAGALQALTLRLPVLAHKFMDAARLGADDFFKRWKQIGAGPREAQRVAKLTQLPRDGSSGGSSGSSSSAAETAAAFIRQTVAGFNWGILEGVDPNGKNVVGASVLHTSGGKYGCLLRLEPNFETMVRNSLGCFFPLLLFPFFFFLSFFSPLYLFWDNYFFSLQAPSFQRV